MKRLLLLRHAKSDWSRRERSDFERTLNDRGLRSAPLMGRHIANHAMVPDKVLCSSSRRTRETLGLMMPFFDREMDIRLLRSLYNASEDDYLEIIRKFGGMAKTLMVLGHNPAMQETALRLAGNGNPDLTEAISGKFPTAGLAVIDFEAPSWSKLEEMSGRAVAFFRPKEIERTADNENGQT
ncbi:histidine phosphatase family protein [Rhizobiales bacterium]|uniref:SixA phosphatase family protein n=1 Tax=Hongsoonwoonella zoysiae TaxID=2821844 RepID=UPI0015615898|nr:histidine phosphatase family protein [Hongsoonwoonella zoysiae]NRG17994.1 histidine phosphatase family protein [Hongsoonwoonella zoysiae]